MSIRRKRIQILPTQQPNRILIHKPTYFRLVIPEEIVMQPSFTVAILVLQSEGLVRVDRPSRPFSDAPKRRIRSTTTDCRGCRSSSAVCRFGRSGSREFVGSFRLLCWSGCVPVPKVRSCRDRYRYRYICRPGGLLAANGCRPKRIRFPLRGRLKLLCFSDGLCLSFCPRRRSCRTKFLSCRLF